MAKVTIVGTQDNEHLMPMGNHRFIIGVVDEVNGVGAKEVPEFVPTRHELLQLVKFWQRVALTDEYFFFLLGRTGSEELRRVFYAWRRMDRVATLLGCEVVTTAKAEVEAEFRETKDPEEWEVFKSGDQEAWVEVQDRFYAELCARKGESRAVTPLIDFNKPEDLNKPEDFEL